MSGPCAVLLRALVIRRWTTSRVAACVDASLAVDAYAWKLASVATMVAVSSRATIGRATRTSIRLMPRQRRLRLPIRV